MEKTLLYLIVALLFIQLPAPAYTWLVYANLVVVVYCVYHVFVNVCNTIIEYMGYVLDGLYEKKHSEDKSK